MTAFVAWFDALDTGVQWALVLGTAFSLMLLGFGLLLAWPVKDDSGWPSIGEVRAELPAPSPEPVPSSPFAPGAPRRIRSEALGMEWEVLK